MASSRAGFTLIELMVVVSIMGLLAATLIPNIVSGRDAANALAEQANLRWHYRGIQRYEQRHGFLPRGTGPFFVLEPWVRLVGGVLFAVGGFWALWGYLTLGTHLSLGNAGDLVDTGAYRHCRNPQYIGTIAVGVGYGLICNSTLTLVGSGITSVTFILMPFAEEPWLRAGLGAAYEAYCARVPRFLPSFSGRRELEASSGERTSDKM